MIASDNSQSHVRASEVILRGGVIGFRTDTFYGLGADPLNQSAVGKIRELKGREEAKPILILISDLSEVDRFITHQFGSFQNNCRSFLARATDPGRYRSPGVAR